MLMIGRSFDCATRLALTPRARRHRARPNGRRAACSSARDGRAV